MSNKLMLLLMPTIGIYNVLSLPKEDGLGVCKTSNTSDSLKLFCCEGFKEINNSCIDCPECKRQEKCPGKFCGDGCVNTCNCREYEECDDWYCCTCAAGFTGPYCNQSCSTDYYGQNCMRKCICFDGGICDHVSGNCRYDTKANISSEIGPSSGTNISGDLASGNIGTFSKGTNVLTYAIVFIVVLGTSCLLLVCIFLVKFISNNQARRSYRLPQVQDAEIQWQYDEINPYNEMSLEELAQRQVQATKTAGHYIEINPYNEIYAEELDRHQIQETGTTGHYEEINQFNVILSEEIYPLRQIYYSSPGEEGSSRKGHSARYINLPTTRSHNLIPRAEGSISKSLSLRNIPKNISLSSIAMYLSLQNLNERENNDNLKIYMQKIHGRRSDMVNRLSTESGRDSDYLHPYSSLIKADVTGSGYLHPYSALETIRGVLVE